MKYCIQCCILKIIQVMECALFGPKFLLHVQHYGPEFCYKFSTMVWNSATRSVLWSGILLHVQNYGLKYCQALAPYSLYFGLLIIVALVSRN